MEGLLSEGHLGFASENWKSLIFIGKPKDKVVNRRFFELCVYSHLAYELRSGDIFIEGADAFSDYRQHLLPLEECDLLAEEYLRELEFPNSAEKFVDFLKKFPKEQKQSGWYNCK